MTPGSGVGCHGKNKTIEQRQMRGFRPLVALIGTQKRIEEKWSSVRQISTG